MRTKERATQSSFCSMIKSRSTRSFSVSAGKEIFVSGRLIPFLEERCRPRLLLPAHHYSCQYLFHLYFQFTIINHDDIARLYIIMKVGIGNIDSFFSADYFFIGKSEDISRFNTSMRRFQFHPPVSLGPCRSPRMAIL